MPGTPARAQSEIGSLAELVEADAGLDDLPPAHFPSYVGHDAPTAQAHFPAAGGDQLEATTTLPTTLPSEGASIPDLLRQLLDGQAALHTRFDELEDKMKMLDVKVDATIPLRVKKKRGDPLVSLVRAGHTQAELIDAGFDKKIVKAFF